MKPKAWMELSLSPSWLVCCSYVRSGHTCWWACQRKGKINPLKLNCRVILLCYPSDPHAAKPTCLVRILDIKMLLTQWFLCILAYLIHFFSSVQGKYRCFFFIYVCCFCSFRSDCDAESAISRSDTLWNMEQHSHKWIPQHWLMGMHAFTSALPVNILS